MTDPIADVAPDPAALLKLRPSDAKSRALWNRKYRKIDFVSPYPNQRDFWALGKTKRERAAIWASQIGKTFCAACEMSYHLTGDYPADWPGRRFDHAITAWAAGETTTATRDIIQSMLCGKAGVAEDFGSGMIPLESFIGRPTLTHGASGSFDMIQVRHKSGGVSTLRFLSFQQGRESFQGGSIDVGWLDEEPPMDVYGEMLTRITATRGMVYATFTPLKSYTEVVGRFINEPSPDRIYTAATIENALHIPESERAATVAGYPEHEREARAKGLPTLGSGAVFRFTEAEVAVDIRNSDFPPYMPRLWGIDFGIGHPFAAVLASWDCDADVLYIVDAFKIKDATAAQQVQRMNAIAPGVSVAWPHDGTAREKSSGEPIAATYKSLGLNMMAEHAQFSAKDGGGYSTEGAIFKLQDRITAGRFKVARHLVELFTEMRTYHRDEGMLVKIMDDLLSALFKIIMALHTARAQAGGYTGRGQDMSGGSSRNTFYKGSTMHDTGQLPWGA
jgi:phage terminase large subunit-like protein